MKEREKLIHDWLAGSLGYSGYLLQPASEDASFRRYYRVTRDADTVIVMDAPPDKEDSRTFVDITGRLRECDVNAPAVHAVDFERGLLLLDDLGHELYLDVLQADNVDRLYGDAMTALHRIQAQARVDGLPHYDAALLQREMNLFGDWLLDRHLGLSLSRAEQDALERAFRQLIDSARQQPAVFVHRDYHSRNLMYCAGQNPGIIDYQDAVLGPVTYDLVSLLKDCYIKWPLARVRAWAREFLQSTNHPRLQGTSEEQWQRWLDLMGVQRHLKASGIFARLCYRDGKPGFLKDVPRTLSHIVDLAGTWPELTVLCDIINDRILPALEDGR